MKDFQKRILSSGMPDTTRIKIESNDSDARRAEAFLNSWEEPFSRDDTNKEQFVFESAVSGTRAELLFLVFYDESNKYGVMPLNPVTERQRWNLNGAMLYVVSGSDAEKVSSLASHFA